MSYIIFYASYISLIPLATCGSQVIKKNDFAQYSSDSHSSDTLDDDGEKKLRVCLS